MFPEFVPEDRLPPAFFGAFFFPVRPAFRPNPTPLRSPNSPDIHVLVRLDELGKHPLDRAHHRLRTVVDWSILHVPSRHEVSTFSCPSTPLSVAHARTIRAATSLTATRAMWRQSWPATICSDRLWAQRSLSSVPVRIVIASAPGLLPLICHLFARSFLPQSRCWPRA